MKNPLFKTLALVIVLALAGCATTGQNPKPAGSTADYTFSTSESQGELIVNVWQQSRSGPKRIAQFDSGSYLLLPLEYDSKTAEKHIAFVSYDNLARLFSPGKNPARQIDTWYVDVPCYKILIKFFRVVSNGG